MCRIDKQTPSQSNVSIRKNIQGYVILLVHSNSKLELNRYDDDRQGCGFKRVKVYLIKYLVIFVIVSDIICLIHKK